MPDRLRVLIAEDRPEDAELIVYQLRAAGYELDWDRVDAEGDFLAHLHPDLDLILADYHMPRFSAPRALELLQESGLDIPFIVVTGPIGEEAAAQTIRAGAADYLLKDRMTRLVPAIKRAIDDHVLLTAKRKTEEALRESDARFRAAREGSLDAFFLLGSVRDRTGGLEDFEFVDLNHRGAELLGRAPADIIGHRFSELFQFTGPDNQLGRYAEVMTTGHVLEEEVDVTEWDINADWIRTQVVPVSDGVAITCRNITEQRRAEWEREELEVQFRQAQKMEAIGLLAGGVAHDFNNMLTVIGGYCDLLTRDTDVTPRITENVAEIRGAQQRAMLLTRQLLAFGRRQVLQPRVFPLRDAVLGLEEMLTRLLGDHIAFTIDVPDDSGNVRADIGRVEQVIMNIVINARDAIDEKGSITVGTRAVDFEHATRIGNLTVAAGAYATLTVEDDGAGIEPSAVGHIFEPFFTTKPKDRGTGLGLSTAFGIIKQSGGHIAVQSTPERGSRFTVLLPRVHESAENPAVLASIAGSVGGSETILVVEDDESIRRMMRVMLMGLGYRVFEATGGVEAMDLLADVPGIHLLIADLVMPGMGGLELCQLATDQYPGVAILYMSGHLESGMGQDLPQPFLEKPFTFVTLSRTVRRVLDVRPPITSDRPTVTQAAE